MTVHLQRIPLELCKIKKKTEKFVSYKPQITVIVKMFLYVAPLQVVSKWLVLGCVIFYEKY